MRRLLFGLLAAAVAAPASAAMIDGTKDASYGPAASVQTVQTQFGDNSSEWNAAYATIEGDRLNLMLTGNLESNFNKLNIWIDSVAGGQTVFDSSGNDNSQTMDGLVFDTPFTADYFLIARRGSGKLDLDFADLAAQTATFYEDVLDSGDFGSGSTASAVNTFDVGDTASGSNVNALPIEVAYDGSNSAGVGGGTAALTPAETAAALAVTTGIELSIALSDLGYTGDPLRVMVAQNGDGNNFFSNQFLGGLVGPQGNLGGDGNGNFTGTAAIDFTTFAGDQFFEVTRVVPEPTSAVLALSMLALGAAVRRRV